MEGVCSPAPLALPRRECFAAMAMQGLLASPIRMTPQRLAMNAVRHADALIQVLDIDLDQAPSYYVGEPVKKEAKSND